MSIASPWVWAGFIAFVLLMLAIDLGLFHRRTHAEEQSRSGFREAVVWSLIWVAVSCVFGLGVWYVSGPRPALEFFTGYVLEKSLSIDNLFVMLAIMQAFALPPERQRTVLLWGVLGALVLRGVLIAAGTALLSLGSWVLAVFGALLLLAAFKLARPLNADQSKPRVPPGAWLKRWLPARLATPTVMAIVSIELADVMFALDSVPAVFSVTQDPFIVFTSNIFALLGLRSLFFVLAGALHRLRYLHLGLAAVLAFVGVKMVLGVAAGLHLSVGASLAIIAGLLTVTIAASLIRPHLASGPVR